MEQLRFAAFAFNDYTRKMRERGRYDFDDMIQWVIAAPLPHFTGIIVKGKKAAKRSCSCFFARLQSV